MGQVTRLLSPPERLVIDAFRRLAPFRESYDLGDLACAAIELNTRLGPKAEAVLAQMLVVDREFAAFWPAQTWRAPGYPAATLGERLLLNLVFCAQSSQFRLEWLAMRFGRGRSPPGLLSNLRRLAALLLMAEVVLPDPARPAAPAAPPRRARPVLAAVKAG